ncbi:MAG: HAMP domain-containing histidine kinase [Clostridia bacterium]|nr:HAMP domain-containing histidine kinase [Clostridia bacterium]
MIKCLRRRMSMLVIGVLILVSLGIVLAIYEVNTRNIILQAESALDVLAENRLGPPEEMNTGEEISQGTPPPKPEGEPEGSLPPGDPKEGGRRMPDPGAMRDGRDRPMSGEEVASLSNSYSMILDEEGVIQSWESARADLYSRESLQTLADQVLETGKTEGRIDTQFFRLSRQEDNTCRLIVLDARLEMMAGYRVLWVTALVAGIACLALSVGAWFLIRRMVRPVEEAFLKQQQFVWDASHELKTPLAVISANADVLEEEIGDNEVLGYIRSEVKRTDSLVRNLLTLARMDRGTAEQERVDMDLSEAVLGVLLPFESTVYEAGKTLESDIREKVRCTGNEAMLQQLTVILLSNALKYSDEHGTIRVSLEKKGRIAELRVENTGEGIASGDLERIFDRFYRTDKSRNSETGGEGLGLAIAKSIVEIHRGKIRAESIPGKSAVFIVDIP